MNVFQKIVKYVGFRDICDLLKILAAAIPGLVLRMFRKDIWLISERENDAHDNGYWFYKYVREKHPEINAYYSISFDCKDYVERIQPLGNAIRHGSFKHHIYMWACSKFISAHLGDSYPARLMSRFFVLYGIYPFKNIFLQHGIIMNHAPFLEAENNRIDLFITSTKPEHDFIVNGLGYPDNAVVIAGLCRYDCLYEFSAKPNQILIMPTWRLWFRPEYGHNFNELVDKWIHSDYYKYYTALLTDPRLIAYAKEKKLDLVFFPHNEMQPFIADFKKSCPDVRVVTNQEYDVQQALKDSSFLITDYSSVLSDFAYMRKPALYFQFDYEAFRKHHYSEGYFSYKDDGYGPICRTVDEAVDYIIQSCENHFQIEKIYLERIERTFLYHDMCNCERNFALINNI